MQFNRIQKKQAFEKLPKEKRDFLASDSFTEVFDSLSQKYSLTDTQSADLYNALYTILLELADMRYLESTLLEAIPDGQKVIDILADISKTFGTYIKPVVETQAKSPSVKTEEKHENILIKQAGMLIEDVAGNKDNVSPTPIKPANPVPGNSFQNTLASQAPSAVAPVAENVVVKKQYPGQDPYREPPKP